MNNCFVTKNFGGGAYNMRCLDYPCLFDTTSKQDTPLGKEPTLAVAALFLNILFKTILDFRENGISRWKSGLPLLTHLSSNNQG